MGFVFLASSLASILGLSSLLLCMSMGAVLVNITKESGMIFKLADEITPPILVMFLLFPVPSWILVSCRALVSSVYFTSFHEV